MSKTVERSVGIRRVVWTDRRGHDGETLYLTSDDVDHLERVYRKHDIGPETIDRVTVEFLLQREALSRYVIKELDLLLSVGGLFEIITTNSKSHSSYSRSRDQVKYEMAVSTNGRYRQVGVERLQGDRVLKLVYKKVGAVLPDHDSIDRWTFGIVTDGKKAEQVQRLVSSIARQGIPEYEILICGPFPEAHGLPHVEVLADVVLVDDVRAPICAKKNKIISAAKYNNLCILHDRFRLPDDWHARFKQYGNYFDFLCLPTLDEASQRFMVDWMSFCDPITRTLALNRSNAYSEWSTKQIIQGGVIVGKKNLMADYMLDERLHWEELEDMHFSKMAYLHGAFFNIDVNNYVISEAVNHRPRRGSVRYAMIKEWLMWLPNVLNNYLKFHRDVRRYHASAEGQTDEP